MLQRLINWLSLTPAERRVILFLTGTLIVGAAIRYYQEAFPPEQKFDYHAADSSFAAFQARIAADTALPDPGHQDHLLNINSASMAELLSLPGIGRTLAEGQFGAVEDLQNIKGISKKKLEKLKPFISIH
jgi:hypothetical protein